MWLQIEGRWLTNMDFVLLYLASVNYGLLIRVCEYVRDAWVMVLHMQHEQQVGFVSAL